MTALVRSLPPMMNFIRIDVLPEARSRTLAVDAVAHGTPWET